MMYGNGEGNTIKHHYAGNIGDKSKKKKKKRKSKTKGKK